LQEVFKSSHISKEPNVFVALRGSKIYAENMVNNEIHAENMVKQIGKIKKGYRNVIF